MAVDLFECGFERVAGVRFDVTGGGAVVDNIGSGVGGEEWVGECGGGGLGVGYAIDFRVERIHEAEHVVE